ncbi:MAG: peptide ABC transporter substrate-binding protein [Patescibacteria group bacterium]
MHKFLSFIKEFRIPKKQDLGVAFASFSRKQVMLLSMCVIVAFVTMVILAEKLNTSFMVEIPADGGSITEGIVGVPTLINPVLALSDADKDITALVYSGLMRKTGDGSFVPDLAESFTVSDDGKIYTFRLRGTAVFHDGTPVTADDVALTIQMIKDPLIKSPRKPSWDGITVEAKDAQTVVFTLIKPYISFMDATTLGILPSHLWRNVTPQEFGLSPLNNKAVGSGPYRIDSISRGDEGIPKTYVLKRFDDFTLGRPHIKRITIVSYANEKDLVKGITSRSVDQASSLSPDNAALVAEKGRSVIHTATLPRMFGVFFNTTKNKVFADPAVIKAFDYALDRQAIVDEVLEGYATVIHNPVPEELMSDAGDIRPRADREEASAVLDKAGWILGSDGIRSKSATKTVTTTKKVGGKTVTEKSEVPTGPATRLAFTLTTGGTPELESTASLIQSQLHAIGAEVEIKRVSETGQLNALIRSRDYEALFFGQIVNHESDLYSFWHSSQKTDPGLNIALYSDPKIDAILENAQKTMDPEKRILAYKDFITEFNKNSPALFIYSPTYLYATSKNLNNVYLDALTIPSDRFASIHTWYREKDHVWKIFTK